MPTLLSKGTFSFYELAKLTKDLQELLKTKTAIEIIITILKLKLQLSGISNRLYFIRGRTGSGKSTLMISEIYKAIIAGHPQSIYITEPRVVLDESNANDILRYNTTWEFGKEMSINNGAKKIPSKYTGGTMCFCTPKIVANSLNEILQQPNDSAALKMLAKYKIIVVDEVHVLDLPTMTLLKNIFDIVHKFGDDKRCPLFIFASATINIPIMVEYYFPKTFENEITNPMLIAEIAGASNYPVVDRFLSETELKNINNEEHSTKDPFVGYQIVAKYLLQHVLNRVWDSTSFIKYNGEQVQCRDVLLFVASKIAIGKIGNHIIKSLTNIPIYLISEESTVDEFLEWRTKNRNRKRLLIIGYARNWSCVSEELLSRPIEQDSEARKFETHLIISTPIIETGKTITTLYVCLDMGLENSPLYNPLTYDYNHDMVVRSIPLNKNKIIQRVGRVGREAPGEFIHFYTEKVMSQLDPYDTPETINSYTLSNMLLDNMKTKKEFIVYDTLMTNNFIYPISTDIMIRSNVDLIHAGFMTIYGEYSNMKSKINASDLWLLYAEYLYYIKKLSLFHSLMISAVYRYSLPVVENVSDIETSNVINNVMDIVNRGTGASDDFIEGIKMARNMLSIIKHKRMSLAVYNRSFVYHKDRVFEPLPKEYIRQPINDKPFDKNHKPFNRDNRNDKPFNNKHKHHDNNNNRDRNNNDNHKKTKPNDQSRQTNNENKNKQITQQNNIEIYSDNDDYYNNSLAKFMLTTVDNQIVIDKPVMNNINDLSQSINELNNSIPITTINSDSDSFLNEQFESFMAGE